MAHIFVAGSPRAARVGQAPVSSESVDTLRHVAVRAPSSAPNSLIDARFDHDACGVGFVASIGAEGRSHAILEHALTALSRLAHRGATAADGKSSDGVGVMTAVPREFFRTVVEIPAEDAETFAVGMVFVPEGEARTERVIEEALTAEGFAVLAWRDVPATVSCLGEIALGTMPTIRQVFVGDRRGEEEAGRERRLYVARKRFERAQLAGEVTGVIVSLSGRTLVYKGMCSGELLPSFFSDLRSELYATPFAVFHQRYATNTLPTWHRAQPGRWIAHNGEINTVWGNRARMDARDAVLPEDCRPVLSKDGTDSTSLDEALELLAQNGRTIAEAVRMLLPPAPGGRDSSTFLRYHMDVVEPWDGPAALAFSDGLVVGAALDRNGLRPSRFAVTADGLVVAGSETGLVDLDPETVVHSGRLGPGQMLVVDLAAKKLYEDRELLEMFDRDPFFGESLTEDQPLKAAEVEGVPETARLLELQRGFGYTREDVRMILQPMAKDGKDAVWSMGDDTPLAYLAKTPRPVYAYFRQRFAQVTNPAIDPLREASVFSLHTRLGPWSSMLDKHAPLPGVGVPSPFLSLGQVETLRQHDYRHADELRLEELHCCFAPDTTLEQAVAEVCARAIAMVDAGARILLLTDRDASAERLPIPMAMATGAVHHALVRHGSRTLVGLAVEAGDCRDVHHAAVLIGFGAGVVCPWLAINTARALAPDAEGGTENERKLLKAMDAGIAKIMSKMGISVVDSYRDAHLFDSLGLHAAVVDTCFYGTPAPLGGIGFAELDAQLRHTWEAPPAPAAELPDYGWVRFRKAEVAEPHLWQPPTVKALQTFVGSVRQQSAAMAPQDPGAAFQAYKEGARTKDAVVLRDLLEIRPAGPELPLEAVEPATAMYPRFISSAMSLGSLSPEAHATITIAMNMLGGRSNTGEGGEDRDVYRRGAPVMAEVSDAGELVSVTGGGAAVAEVATTATVTDRALLNNKIKQVASGRFGVTAEYLAHADEIEIKVAQGAKPGEGGQLPGFKVSGLIARLRHAQPGVSLISPPPHHDIYSIEDLAQLIFDLKRVNPKAAVGVKLVSSFGVGTVAAGVAKAYADFIVIAGNTGGTGAAALSSIKYAGNPWELGLAEAQQVLAHNGMRGRVRLRTDGGLATAKDVLIAALLGADEFAFGTAVLVAMGCDMARQCHLNTCPVGIATQKPELRAKFRGKPEHVVRFFEAVAEDLRGLLARYGLPSIEAAIGRADLLEQVRFDGGIELKPMLARVEEEEHRWGGGRNTQPLPVALDEPWVEPALQAIEAGRPWQVDARIANKDRAVGARLAGELALRRAQRELPAEVRFDLHGVAGQSFGAFAVEGMTLVLDGQANDFVGKGLSGGRLVIRPRGLAAKDSGQHVILGNVALYGATAGEMFAAGRVGERFAVRNSGATTVVEGVGEHGCEYMTGGTVVVLGEAGGNFGAGMTGGLAWVMDADGSFVRDGRYHGEFVEPTAFEDVDADTQEMLRALVERHRAESGSSLATRLLEGWPEAARGFVRLTPKAQA